MDISADGPVLKPVAPVSFHPVAPPHLPFELELPPAVSLDFSALDRCLQDLEAAQTKQQVAALAEQVTILAIQLRSINSEMSLAVNGMRSALATLTAGYGSHFHLIPAGMTTVNGDSDPIRVLVAEVGLYQGQGSEGVGLVSLEGTSGPRSAPHPG